MDLPLRVKLSPSKFREEAVKIFDTLNEIDKTIITLDEAQYLRFSTVGLRSLIAYIYDNLKNVTLILTGSEVGLLYEFIGINDPDSELYGRYYKVIEVKPFDKRTSIEFLAKGFEEIGVKYDEGIINRASEELGGIPGWLVYFGKLYKEKGENALKEVKELGSELVRKEINELLLRSPYYIYILKAIAVLGNASWKNIMDYVIAKSGKNLPNSTISRDINNLLKMGFIKKDNGIYSITDPIVKYTLLEKF